MDKLLVYIAGSGRCGSTLLDQILNNSPYITALGEIHRLTWQIVTEWEPCCCGKPVSECPFWRKVEAEAQTMLGVCDEPLLRTRDPMIVPGKVSFVGTLVQALSLFQGGRAMYQFAARVFAPAHEEAVRHSMMWYEAVRRVTGCPLILDSTKDARRMKLLYFAAPRQFRLIYMVRDGRAVAASAIRRLGVSMREAARRWVWRNKISLLCQRGIPPEQKIKVRYEQLCTDQETIVGRVCRFLGVPFEPDMLVLRKADSHSIGGNPMRFRQQEAQIHLDERWRRELSNEDLKEFERVAGRLNRKLGFAP